MLSLIVGCEALEVAYGYGLVAHLEVYTTALALLLLRTYATTYGRQGRGELEHAGCFEYLAALDVLDERGDVDAHGTTFHTGGVGAVETALGLGECLLHGESLVYLLAQLVAAIGGVELGHHAALYGSALLRLYALAQGLAPFAVAVDVQLTIDS